jgi:hypothetical protein
MQRSANNENFLKLFASSSDSFWYEKHFIKFVDCWGSFGRNGWLRADKKASGAGEGGTRWFTFRASRLGLAVCRRAVHAADHV